MCLLGFRPWWIYVCRLSSLMRFFPLQFMPTPFDNDQSSYGGPIASLATSYYTFPWLICLLSIWLQYAHLTGRWFTLVGVWVGRQHCHLIHFHLLISSHSRHSFHHPLSQLSHQSFAQPILYSKGTFPSLFQDVSYFMHGFCVSVCMFCMHKSGYNGYNKIVTLLQ